MIRNRPTLVACCLLAVAACAGHAYLPDEPGGARSDLSGADVRAEWIEGHPEAAPDVVEAIREGVFVPGMTVEHRDVVTNPKRKGSSGNGFWRSRSTGDEMRYQWFVSGQREPFIDGRQRMVCELVFVGDRVTEVRYCPPQAETRGLE